MRVDKEFDAKFTEPFLIGGEIVITPDISDLNLSVGEWWYGNIIDELCNYQIKVENTPTGYVVTQGACGSEPCDVNTGACLEAYSCGECCDGIEAQTDCDINEILSPDLDVVVDENNCKSVTLSIKAGVIPEAADPFCLFEDGTLVTNVTPNSIIPFCEGGNKYGILFGDLCADLSACTGGDGDVTIINNPVVDVSNVDATLCGMVVEKGIIQSVIPNWCDQFATDAELTAAIAGISVGVVSLTVTNPITNTGTAANPIVGLSAIFGSNQSFFGGSLTTDKWGRVLTGDAATPWLTAISSGDVWIDVTGSVITHNTPSTVTATLDNGTEIDDTGHVVGVVPGHRIARWSGNTTSLVVSYQLNMVGLPGAGVVNYTFTTPMLNGSYHLSILNSDGTPTATGATSKSAAGFTVADTLGDITIFVQE